MDLVCGGIEHLSIRGDALMDPLVEHVELTGDVLS